MVFITWKEELSIGFVAIDNDHKKLIAFVNELYQGIQDGREREVLVRILDDLVDFTRIHFGREERMLAEAGLSSTVAHKREHDELGSAVLKARADYLTDGVVAPSLEMMVFLKGWLLAHIMESDKNDFWCLKQLKTSRSYKPMMIQNASFQE